MKLLYIICLLVTCTVSMSYGQCGSIPLDSADAVNQPHFGNNQILLDMLDTLEGPSNTSHARVFGQNGLSQAIRKIPVKVNIYRNSQGREILPYRRMQINYNI